MKGLAALAALALGCAVDGGAVADRGRAELRVWAHDAALEFAARNAADRIADASGLVVEVQRDLVDLPIFRSESLAEHGWAGLFSGDQIAIDPSAESAWLETIVLHELLHALGAGHIEGPAVMSEAPSSEQLTAADLEELCSRAACDRFNPEL